MMGGRLARRLLAPAVLLLLVVASATSVSAQSTPTPVANSQFSGRVTNLNPLTVNSNGQDRRVTAGPNAVITRGGGNVAVGDLRVGDVVNVTANPDGTASRIETTEAAQDGLPSWLIPLLLGLLLLGALLYFLTRRGKKDNFVLERDRNTTGTTGTTGTGTGTGGTTR